ncbi:hypothetical protein GUJ93_ZPchr0012g21684 [Zizania palustris]|uniref:Uncharacterized protein n=1 Tax=Zizania palustris TaxID=103762 RepID=A0A8J5WTW3_ZIZPA|nr:hypothetical protein GUJ93_ZPchr0012g21684 [Zizania palustris]
MFACASCFLPCAQQFLCTPNVTARSTAPKEKAATPPVLHARVARRGKTQEATRPCKCLLLCSGNRAQWNSRRSSSPTVADGSKATAWPRDERCRGARPRKEKCARCLDSPV